MVALVCFTFSVLLTEKPSTKEADKALPNATDLPEETPANDETKISTSVTEGAPENDETNIPTENAGAEEETTPPERNPLFKCFQRTFTMKEFIILVCFIGILASTFGALAILEIFDDPEENGKTSEQNPNTTENIHDATTANESQTMTLIQDANTDRGWVTVDENTPSSSSTTQSCKYDMVYFHYLY